MEGADLLPIAEEELQDQAEMFALIRVRDVQRLGAAETLQGAQGAAEHGLGAAGTAPTSPSFLTLLTFLTTSPGTASPQDNSALSKSPGFIYKGKGLEMLLQVR